MEPIPIAAIPGFGPTPAGELTPVVAAEQAAPKRSKRSPNRGEKVDAVQDMPYSGTLPSAMAFTQAILDGGDENAISGHHKLTDEEYLAIYNRSPKMWFAAGKFAYEIAGYMSPSAAVALYVVANRLEPARAALFTNAVRDPAHEISTELLLEVMEIDGDGQRVEQLRTALIAFREFAELKRARPIFPHLTRR
jgi:hypothetical protein